MPMPSSGPISFSQLQAEFGGANPISMSEYVRGGAYVPNGPTANNNIPTTTSGMSMSKFYGSVKASIVNPLTNRSLNYDTVGSTAVSVWMNVYSDGTMTGFRQGNVQLWSQNWFNPTTTSVGNGYWIRGTLQSGLAPSSGDALNTWHQLNGVRGWTYTATGGGSISSRSGTVLVQIATDSAGSNIVTSGTFAFSVTREF